MIKLIAIIVVCCMPLLTACASNAEKSQADADAPSLGRILTTDKGMTLYMYDPDVGAICSDGCTMWPPYGYARHDAPLASATYVEMVLKWYDELKVWSINGRPLHTFVGDKKPGDTKSDGVAGWFVAREP